MANLGKKNGIYLARFRYQGKEYKRSLKTTDRQDAEGALHEVQRAIHRLTTGQFQVPEGVDPGDFIVSGGTLEAPGLHPQPRHCPTLQEAVNEYLMNLEHLAESNRYTIGVHLRNLLKKLPDRIDTPVDQLQPRDLEAFLQARLKERAHTTVSKERETVLALFHWVVRQGYLVTSPTAELTPIKASSDSLSFRTVEEIEEILSRGGLSQSEAWALWDCLFLTPAEIAEVLALVRERSQRDTSFILHALPAFTGMRRGELLRLRWIDVEFDQTTLIARSKKQSRQVVETTRRIDMHPELKVILEGWQASRPRGQHVVCDADSQSQLTLREANQRFWQPLRGTKWCLSSSRDRFKIGFHTYRHSFASNLAAAGVDQRLIDQWMGHQTEDMRQRYRHLFLKDRRSAIESFSLLPQP